MAKSTKLSTINLKPQDEFDKSVVGKILKWSLTTGKSIVILTEFVVILAFLSRFKLDQDLNDVNEQIVQKQFLLESFQSVEDQMIKIQDKLSLVEQINNTTIKIRSSIEELTLLTPSGVRIESIEFSQGGWIIKAQADSESDYAEFVNRLSSSDKFEFVETSGIKFDLRTSKISFNVDARFPEKKAAPKKTTSALRGGNNG